MRTKFLHAAFLLSSISFFITSCQKEKQIPSNSNEEISTAANNGNRGNIKQTKTFSSESALKWQDLQLRILRLLVGANCSEHFEYFEV